jgi:MSHA biogenesis protein MshI
MLEKLASMISSGQSRQKQAAHIAAVYLHSDCLKLVLLQSTPLQVLKVQTLVLGADNNLQQTLLQLCTELPAHTQLCLVLGSDRYQLVQLDKPAVKADEMLQALPWLVRELTSVPVEDMLLDYLDLPEHTSAQGARINVVVTSKSSMLELCRALQRKNIQLRNIQPEEWLPRNLIPQQSAAVMLLVHQPGQELSLQIVKQGMVYFSRKLRGFSRIDQYEMSELRQGMLDNLLLEVQRSLDYFEGQLRQAPVKEILFQIATAELPAIVRYFTENGFVQVRQLELSALMPKLTLAEQQEYWLTMAGAVELLKAGEQANEAQG